MTTSYLQGEPNYAEDINKAHGDLSTEYSELIDIGTQSVNTQFIFVNLVDVDITLKFSTGTKSTTFLIEAGKKLEMNGYRHQGLVSCKLNSSSSSGSIKLVTWKK